ncbi:MAG: cation:proton antiporter [Verrucomicrobia bacterium]|nr:cation:proton antiporter [Verrucomicrobiota bacterium]
MLLTGLFLLMLFAHSLMAARLEGTAFTPPLLMAMGGVLAAVSAPALHQAPLEMGTFLHVAELGLVLLLFADASRADLRLLRQIRALPARLLTTGLLGTILLGLLAACGVFPSLSLWEAGILAAILAPTDAGLGQVVVSSPRVPRRIREALLVEAGLNDGLSVPFLLFFSALATRGGGDAAEASLLRYVLEQLGIGVLVGAGIGGLGGLLIARAHRHRWASASGLQLGVVTLPLLCLLASLPLGASAFIAAFVAGLAVQRPFPEAARHCLEFTEGWGQLFNLAVFFLFGLLVVRAWPGLSWMHLLYAGLSLTLIRMLPVALALRGTGLSRATHLFIGWFGPRGLASVVLGLVYLEQHRAHTGEETIRLTVVATVALSIVLHGVTANPGMAWYARAVGRLPSDAPELDPGSGIVPLSPPSSPA